MTAEFALAHLGFGVVLAINDGFFALLRDVDGGAALADDGILAFDAVGGVETLVLEMILTDKRALVGGAIRRKRGVRTLGSGRELFVLLRGIHVRRILRVQPKRQHGGNDEKKERGDSHNEASDNRFTPARTSPYSGSAVPSTTHCRASGTCAKNAFSVALRCSA